MSLHNRVQVIQLHTEDSVHRASQQASGQQQLPGIDGPTEDNAPAVKPPHECARCTYWDFHNAHLCQLCPHRHLMH